MLFFVIPMDTYIHLVSWRGCTKFRICVSHHSQHIKLENKLVLNIELLRKKMERRAPSRVSEAQWNILMDFLESNPSLARARGYNNSARGRAEAFRLWQEVATLLNAEGSGTTKSPKEWSVYVSNYKSKLKKIVADINADASATGGGPPRASNMTEFETRFLALLGAGFGQTAPRVMVLPFANEEPSTSAREAESQMVLVEEVDDDTQCQEEEVADDNIQHSIDIDDPLQILPDPPAQPATPRASLPEANEPLLPRRRRQRGQRTRLLAPLDEARRILSQVELQRAAADAANARAHEQMARNLLPLAEMAHNLGRLADIAQQYIEYLLTLRPSP